MEIVDTTAARRFTAAVCALVGYEVRPGNTVTFSSLVDLSSAERLRRDMVLAGAAKPSYTAVLIKAIALALREHRYANSRIWRFPVAGWRRIAFDRVDAAVLCERDLPDAPMAAFCDVIRDADKATLGEINAWLRALTACDETNNRQWREFKTLVTKFPSWLSRWMIRLPAFIPGLWIRYRGGAFVVSSSAKYGVDVVQGVWQWPLGFSFGLVKPRPVGIDGRVELRPTFTLAMNFDRRVMAGAQAARFFKRITDILEQAGTELAEGSPAVRPETASEVEAGALLAGGGKTV